MNAAAQIVKSWLAPLKVLTENDINVMETSPATVWLGQNRRKLQPLQANNAKLNGTVKIKWQFMHPIQTNIERLNTDYIIHFINKIFKKEHFLLMGSPRDTAKFWLFRPVVNHVSGWSKDVHEHRRIVSSSESDRTYILCGHVHISLLHKMICHFHFALQTGENHWGMGNWVSEETHIRLAAY